MALDGRGKEEKEKDKNGLSLMLWGLFFMIFAGFSAGEKKEMKKKKILSNGGRPQV